MFSFRINVTIHSPSSIPLFVMTNCNFSFSGLILENLHPDWDTKTIYVKSSNDFPKTRKKVILLQKQTRKGNFSSNVWKLCKYMNVVVQKSHSFKLICYVCYHIVWNTQISAVKHHILLMLLKLFSSSFFSMHVFERSFDAFYFSYSNQKRATCW